MGKDSQSHAFPASESVKHIRYFPGPRELDVAFVKDGEYRYFGVGEQLFEKFRTAESAGRFLHKHILGKYRYRRLR